MFAIKENVRERMFAKGDVCERMFAKGDGGKNVRQKTFAKSDRGLNVHEERSSGPPSVSPLIAHSKNFRTFYFLLLSEHQKF